MPNNVKHINQRYMGMEVERLIDTNILTIPDLL